MRRPMCPKSLAVAVAFCLAVPNLALDCPALSSDPQALVDAAGKARTAGKYDVAKKCTNDAIAKASFCGTGSIH
jgi:hypothetical protein